MLGGVDPKLEARINAMVTDKKTEPKSVVVLFGLQNNANSPEIFNLMKAACNEKRQGLQSIGINLATLCNELNDTSNGLLRYTDRIYRKMFARTPKDVGLDLTSNLQKVRDRSMALHVTRYPHGKQQKVSYLVAFALRDLWHVRNCRTAVELVDPHENPNA